MTTRFRLTYDSAIEKLRMIYAPKIEVVIESPIGQSLKSEALSVEVVSSSQPQTEIENSELEINTSEKEVEVSEVVSTSQQSKAAACLGEACRKKAHKDCIHRMCFLCCYTARKLDHRDCAAHHAQTVEREREDRYIEEGLAKKSKKTSLPFFYEERFSDSEQTVVVWCLKDFAQTKKWNEECFSQEFRKERQQVQLRRRQQWREEPNSREKPSAVTPSKTSLKKRGRVLRYAKIRSRWNDFALNLNK